MEVFVYRLGTTTSELIRYVGFNVHNYHKPDDQCCYSIFTTNFLREEGENEGGKKNI
jgi:hypothetical protein